MKVKIEMSIYIEEGEQQGRVLQLDARPRVNLSTADH